MVDGYESDQNVDWRFIIAATVLTSLVIKWVAFTNKFAERTRADVGCPFAYLHPPQRMLQLFTSIAPIVVRVEQPEVPFVSVPLMRT